MIIANASALNKYLSKPKQLKIEDDCILLVKQLKLAEFEALKAKVAELEGETDETKNLNMSIDIIASLVVDEMGKLMYNTPEAIQDLKDNLTLDFVRKFFDLFWASFAFTQKELASSEAQFRA